MSASAHSAVYQGVWLQLQVEEFQQEVTRFNPKDGSPVPKNSPSFHMTVMFKGFSYTLPADTKFFIDEPAKRSGAFSDLDYKDWRYERIAARLDDWLRIDQHPRLTYFRKHYGGTDILIGQQLVEGAAPTGLTDKSMVQIPVPSNAETEEIRREITQLLLPYFGPVPIEPQLWLSTQLC